MSIEGVETLQESKSLNLSAPFTPFSKKFYSSKPSERFSIKNPQDFLKFQCSGWFTYHFSFQSSQKQRKTLQKLTNSNSMRQEHTNSTFFSNVFVIQCAAKRQTNKKWDNFYFVVAQTTNIINHLYVTHTNLIQIHRITAYITYSVQTKLLEHMPEKLFYPLCIGKLFHRSFFIKRHEINIKLPPYY